VFADFSDSPLSVYYQDYFAYCQDYLDRDFPQFNIHPARIYFNTNITFNGAARKNRGYYLVEICQGIFAHLNTFYRTREHKFDEPFLIPYRDMTLGFRQPPGYLLLQFMGLYLFYHEVGHLIQIQGESPTHYAEYLEDDCIGPEVAKRHMRELDADWFAAYNMASHIFVMLEKGDDNKLPLDAAMATDLIALILSGLYMHFIERSAGHPGIYYDKECHPHPAVRLSYMTMFLLQNMQGNVTGTLDVPEIIKKTVGVSEYFMKEEGKNIVADQVMAIVPHAKPINDYVGKILADTQSYPYLSMHTLFHQK
jgi:hypothetical protein